MKQQVEARWRDDQISERLAAKAAELEGKLKNGVPFPELASQSGLKLQSLWGLKRGNASGPLSVAAIEAVFQTPKDAPATTPGQGPGERIVFRVTDVKIPVFDAAAPEAKRYEEALRQSLADDLFGAYVAQLEADLGVTINEDAFRRIAGGESE